MKLRKGNRLVTKKQNKTKTKQRIGQKSYKKKKKKKWNGKQEGEMGTNRREFISVRNKEKEMTEYWN